MYKRNIVLIVMAGMLSHAAWAQPGENEDGFYIGAALGNFSTEIDDVDEADFDFDEDESASRLFAGWRFNNFFAVQLDRCDFSEANDASGLLDVSADTKGWAPSVVGGAHSKTING